MNTEHQKVSFRSAEYEEDTKLWRLSLFDKDGNKIGGDVLTPSNEEVTDFLQTKKK